MRCGSGGSERVGEGGVLGSPREAEAAGGECAELQRLSPPISVFCCPATPRTKAKSRYVSLSLFNSISFSLFLSLSLCFFLSHSLTLSLLHTQSDSYTNTHTNTLCLSSLFLTLAPFSWHGSLPHPPPHPTTTSPHPPPPQTRLLRSARCYRSFNLSPSFASLASSIISSLSLRLVCVALSIPSFLSFPPCQRAAWSVRSIRSIH